MSAAVLEAPTIVAEVSLERRPCRYGCGWFARAGTARQQAAGEGTHSRHCNLRPGGPVQRSAVVPTPVPTLRSFEGVPIQGGEGAPAARAPARTWKLERIPCPEGCGEQPAFFRLGKHLSEVHGVDLGDGWGPHCAARSTFYAARTEARRAHKAAMRGL